MMFLSPRALIAASLAAVAFTAGWQAQHWRMNSQIAALQKQYAQESAQAQEAARTAQHQFDTRYQEAIHEAREREHLLRTEIDSLRAASRRLREQATLAARRLR